jgi:sugar lactone lactonase YvrE
MLEIRIVLLTLLALLPVSVFAAPVTPPVTLHASVEQPAYREGQPVMLALTLHNDAAKNLFTASAFEASAFQITVLDEAGHPVPRTAVGERILTPPNAVSANSIATFSLGQTLSYRFNLARLFDLSRAGVYTVTVSRRFRPWILPRPAVDTPPQEIALSAGPLKFRMVEDVATDSGPTALTPVPSHQTFLYIASQYSPGVSRYRVGEDDSVSSAFDPKFDPRMPASDAPSPLPTLNAGPDAIVCTPNGRFLYTGNAGDNTVSQYRIGDDGVLSSLSPPKVSAQELPGHLIMDPKGRFLYALHNRGNTWYTIGPDGRLTVKRLMPGSAWSSDPNHTVAPTDVVTINSTGTFLYACNGLTYLYRLAPDGSVTALPAQTAGLPDPNMGRANAISLSPDGKFAFVGVSRENGSAFFDLIMPMRVAQNGTLTPLPGLARTPQTPIYPKNFNPPTCSILAVDPTGRFLIALCSNFLDCYRIGSDGSLAFLSMTTEQGDLDSVLFVPSSPLAYVHNRNSTSAPSLLAFRLDEQHGLVPAGLDMPDGVPFDATFASAVAPKPLKRGPMSGGISMSARLPADVLPVNAPVVLTVTLKNETQHPVKLGAAGLDMAGFRLAVAGPQRQSPGVLRGDGEPLAAAVPLLAAGRDLFGNLGSSTVPVVLLPGKERQYRFVLSRLSDLTVAGHYTVQITRLLPSGISVASPVVPFLLDGPFDGITRDGKYSVQIL